MREIKFRAWDKKEKRMVQVHQINWEDIDHISISFDSCWHCDIKDYILMQYTGLKDRKGKECCEGDLIRQGQSIKKIEWDQRFCRFGFIAITDQTTDDYQQKDFEVIGNIYENPELINKE